MRGYPDGLRAWDMPFATIVETLYEAKLLLTLGWVGHHATIAYLAVIRALVYNGIQQACPGSPNAFAVRCQAISNIESQGSS